MSAVVSFFDYPTTGNLGMGVIDGEKAKTF